MLRLEREATKQVAHAATNARKIADVAAQSESVMFKSATTIKSGPISSMAIKTINGHMGSNDIKSTFERPLRNPAAIERRQPKLVSGREQLAAPLRTNDTLAYQVNRFLAATYRIYR